MVEKNILVLGVGNLLLGDEGAGIHVIRELEKKSLPKGILLLDGGTGGYELIRFFKGMKKVIIIDAIKADEKPGTIVRLTLKDITPYRYKSLSVHQNGLLELLQKVKDMRQAPEIILYGIVIKEIKQYGLNLSGEIKPSIAKLISLIVIEIENIISENQ
jgi:hydrogenase maturation protease